MIFFKNDMADVVFDWCRRYRIKEEQYKELFDLIGEAVVADLADLIKMDIDKSDLLYLVADWCLGNEVSRKGFEQLLTMVENGGEDDET